ncbi:hypothetical protein [Mucilaginibacter phyllosphaerae]|uniref:Aromatic hydrocarbon degradation protein n=1 Tax=Mucilaginibacter phyllosphaerae TaxID=1812349 RepID=A0A4Y8ABJ7_9SPHI|nr:hypothetical protein [Mucilaginibacter phyllosphaerae]MBB3969855.1 hypothetical protein [Mucilaginibacter phyllosphaerae]TEW65229.1 hypothetical protein E2R65_15060 [Mucilaginibacter phyllosphaerae]GGH17155.1 membrane protein [Mucilaginibacter phyllosphaerae]
MIKNIRFLIILFLFTVTAFGVKAQSTATTSSPYSRYGLGDISPMLLPQNLAMGGIGVATNRINNFYTINPLNPASYSAIGLTVIDAGIYGKFNTLEKSGQASQTNANFRLSHVAFGIPVSKRSALSFGLMPYSELGYSYKQVSPNFSTGLPSDTSAVNYIYNGDGGLSKFYIGYGFGIGKHLSIGANISYIFGNLKETQSTEVPSLAGVLNSRIEESNSITGLNYDYGVQYSVDFSPRKHLTFGYSASANTKLNTANNYIVSSYYRNASGDEGVATDSLVNNQQPSAKIQLPMINRFGVSYQYDGKFLIGADYTMSNWSKLTVAGVNKSLNDSKTINVGGQFTPNVNSLSNYFASVDYRLGFIYDQTYLRVNNTDIKRYAVTGGLGLPLRANNTSFYRINIGAEVGKRGTLTNSLVQENYINVHLSFTLNDKWFQKYRFD